MTIKEITLFKPYTLSFLDQDEGFVIFLDKNETMPLVLEHNPKINSVLIHRWDHYSWGALSHKVKKDYDLIDFENYRYVIKALFESNLSKEG
jgi:hypothetical protein